MSKKISTKDKMSHLFNRYVWLIDLIYRKGKMTFEEINEAWNRASLNYTGADIPLKTFHNHRRAIEEMFDINIECNRKGGYYYYIENVEEIDNGGVRTWLVNALSVNNLTNENSKLRQRILFEKNPSGQKYLTTIIEAMRENTALTMVYHSFSDAEARTVTLEPYAVKVFKQRWYVVGHWVELDKIRIYALDRIQNLESTELSYEFPNDFSLEDYFYNSYGITYKKDLKVEQVRVKVNAEKANYIKTLPLHHSQKEVEQQGDFTIFAYHVIPTYDFCQELLSHADELEVLSPQWLRDKITTIIRNQYKMYVRE